MWKNRVVFLLSANVHMQVDTLVKHNIAKRLLFHHSHSHHSFSFEPAFHTCLMAPKKQQPPQNKYSIVLPTYNEKDNIPLVFWLLNDTLTKANIDFEVVVVDDNSPDGTQDVVRRLQKAYGTACLKLVTRYHCVYVECITHIQLVSIS